MTEVAFHSGLPDKLDYACRLLRKAWRQGVRVVVTGASQELAQLDQALWVIEHEEFIPHLRLRAGEALPAHLKRTPIWLCEVPPAQAEATVVVNLGPGSVPCFDAFERVIELVSTAEPDVASGRQRWRQFVAAGATPVNRPYAATAH